MEEVLHRLIHVAGLVEGWVETMMLLFLPFEAKLSRLTRLLRFRGCPAGARFWAPFRLEVGSLRAGVGHGVRPLSAPESGLRGLWGPSDQV
jgi:hypothetical protein